MEEDVEAAVEGAGVPAGEETSMAANLRVRQNYIE